VQAAGAHVQHRGGRGGVDQRRRDDDREHRRAAHDEDRDDRGRDDADVETAAHLCAADGVDGPAETGDGE